MDDAIGKILDELDRLGVADNTLVVFFSDNGGSNRVADNTPLRGHKAQMWEGGLRVPFIARWPGRLPKGKVIDEFLTSLEVFPTFTNVAGGELPDDVIYDGFNMLPVLRSENASQRTEMFWQRRSHKAARYKNWKWVEAGDQGGLFDLVSDIGEQKDLSESHPEVLADLKARWGAWRKEMDEAEPRGPFRDY